MAVQGTYTPVREAGNGSKVDFDFDFKVIQASDLSVGKILNSTEVKTTLTLGVDYTVSINTVTDGGTVTYMVAPTALQDSWIGRAVPATQETDIPTNSIFREVQVENALDKLTMVVQQNEEEIARCVKLPDTSTGVEPILPTPEDGRILSWSGTSGLMVNTDLLPGPTGPQGPAGADGIFTAIASQAEAEAGAENTKGMTPLRVAEAIAALAGGKAIELSFVNADLSTGVLTVTHSQGLSAGYTAIVQIVNNSGAVVIPDQINTFATNSFKVDLTSYGTISGTWYCTYIVKG
jgi:hypothetical protein